MLIIQGNVFMIDSQSSAMLEIRIATYLHSGDSSLPIGGNEHHQFYVEKKKNDHQFAASTGSDSNSMVEKQSLCQQRKEHSPVW